MQFIINSLVVFALSLLLTKSKIFAGKREFVEQRYEAVKTTGDRPGWIHRIWHAWWTCPMCSGFWIAIPVCVIYPIEFIVVDVLVVFALNWLLHCIENVLFFSGEVAEQLSELPDNELYQKVDKIATLVEREKRDNNKFSNRK